MIRLIAQLAPMLAPIPSAWFIGRSVYYHLLYRWQPELGISIWLNLAVAIVAGLAIELLAIASVYLASSLYRWNNYGHVRKEKGAWEKAPFGISLAVTGVYFAVAIYLLVVLEAMPELAPYSAVAFPLLAGVGAVNWALYQQHQDRLDYYGKTWSFRAAPRVETGETAETAGSPRSERLSQSAFTPDAKDRAIMDTWRDSPALSYSEMSQRVGVSKSTVGSRAQSLEAAGLIVRTTDGVQVRYSDNGRQ